MIQAFILGAGLGTRLRPLTDHLPKPLVPLFHKPLATWAINACSEVGIRRFAVNTHHLPQAWDEFEADGTNEITFFHEPILLETGGGLKNIESWTNGAPLLVHNGDVFSSMPLKKLIAAHQSSGMPVTLALRSQGEAKHIALDSSGTCVTDIRNRLGNGEGTHVFTGIYCVNPVFFEMFKEGEKVSVIPPFMELIRQDRLGAIVIDEGVWLDLGDRDSYLRAHLGLDLSEKIHSQAVVKEGAVIENSVIGAGAVIECGAVVKDSVVWAGGKILTGAEIDECIVCSKIPVTGKHIGTDL